MALTREPEKPEIENFQRRTTGTGNAHWKALMERTSKQRVNLRKAFSEHFSTWLDEVEAELNSMTVRPIRSKAEE